MGQLIDKTLVDSISFNLRDEAGFDITRNSSIKKDLYSLTKLNEVNGHKGSIDTYCVQSGDCTILAYIRDNNEILKTAVVTI